MITAAGAAASPEELSITCSSAPEQVSPGSSGELRVLIRVPAGSHIYANPKGDGTGKPTTISAEADGITFGKAKYPQGRPSKNIGEDETVYIYEGEVEITLPFTTNASAAAGKRNIALRTDALACTDTTCTPVSIKTDAAITITGENIPQPIYIEATGIGSLPIAIILGLLAGFILNFMPCVLPVVSLKVLSFARHAGESRGQLLATGASFAAGILASFVLLACLAAFAGFGWGSLFQHKPFLIGMTAIVFALGLSLLGVFTLNVPSFAGKAEAGIQRQNIAGAFCRGALATLLATPCSGPFLGGVLAWALASGSAATFAVFTSIGVGMAAPYVLLSAFPALIGKLPRSGTWIITFEQIMGFLLMGTTVYLLSIFTDGDMLPMIAFLLFVAAGVSVWGKWGGAQNSKNKRVIAFAAATCMLMCGLWFSFGFLAKPERTSITLSNEQTFSLNKLKSARDAGKITVVKFTAKWCPNCKLAETALAAPEVQSKIVELGAELVTADITTTFPEAEDYMQSLGSRSIPFLAVLPSGENFTRPVCLRDIYTKSDVLRALEQAATLSGRP